MNPQSSLYLRRWIWVYLFSRIAGSPGCFGTVLKFICVGHWVVHNLFIEIKMWWDLLKSKLHGPLFFLKLYNWAVLLRNIGQILLQIAFISWLLPISLRTCNIWNHYCPFLPLFSYIFFLFGWLLFV